MCIFVCVCVCFIIVVGFFNLLSVKSLSFSRTHSKNEPRYQAVSIRSDEFKGTAREASHNERKRLKKEFIWKWNHTRVNFQNIIHKPSNWREEGSETPFSIKCCYYNMKLKSDSRLVWVSRVFCEFIQEGICLIIIPFIEVISVCRL